MAAVVLGVVAQVDVQDVVDVVAFHPQAVLKALHGGLVGADDVEAVHLNVRIHPGTVGVGVFRARAHHPLEHHRIGQSAERQGDRQERRQPDERMQAAGPASDAAEDHDDQTDRHADAANPDHAPAEQRLQIRARIGPREQHAGERQEDQSGHDQHQQRPRRLATGDTRLGSRLRGAIGRGHHRRHRRR